MENKTAAKFLLIEGGVDLGTTKIKEKIDAAEVVFVGLKLVKNVGGGKVYDRVGTLIAKSEIDKLRRHYHRSEIEEVFYGK